MSPACLYSIVTPLYLHHLHKSIAKTTIASRTLYKCITATVIASQYMSFRQSKVSRCIPSSLFDAPIDCLLHIYAFSLYFSHDLYHDLMIFSRNFQKVSFLENFMISCNNHNCITSIYASENLEPRVMQLWRVDCNRL